jgi:hypothetical protein
MPKLGKTRLVIKDYTNHYWRLCNFSHSHDKFGEPFIKIMFPGFSRGSVSLTKGVGFREKDGALLSPEHATSTPNNSSEITYHYVSGILNLKGGCIYASQYRWFPRLKKSRTPVLMCRCLLKDFQVCKRLKSFDKDQDLILDKFPLPRVLGFYASYGDSPETISREDGRCHAFVCEEDKKLLITVTEYALKKLENNALVTNKDPYAWLRGTTVLSRIWHGLKWEIRQKWRKFFY